MTKLTKNANLFSIFCIIVLMILIARSNKKIIKPELTTSMQEKALNFSGIFYEVFGFGQERVIADFIWITTLLDGDLDHYKKKDKNSWMYLRFKSIVDLDPLNLEAYKNGGKYLTIIKDDLLGGEDILKQGIYYYPDNYDIRNDISFLYVFELKDYKKAYTHYSILKKFKKSGKFIKSLLFKLRHLENDDIDLSYEILLNYYSSLEKNHHLKTKIAFDLNGLKTKIDLDCLNNNNNNCDKENFFNEKYIYSDGKYKTPREVKEYTLYHNK